MSKKTLKYQEAMLELQNILDGLESEQIDVDEVSLKVARAVELISFCREKIEKTELEVRKIVKEFDRDSEKNSG
ncbi:MAG: exodeoxyribonuclease VII small subunit [Candidatus Omnitrophica bacterium]|nr:exodeoxyribonuclease VII small subunit [Candidatus Omnitrophota bacterium]MBU2044816.1 exodeoxyribonuclease VII small subunit [Candidatus Omnitrophota bacterium]MBU2251065.1 exodeoxyribonuclease VII small subunit [Candidatus Omnitrophota bacterium]